MFSHSYRACYQLLNTSAIEKISMRYLVKVFTEHFAFGLTIPFTVVWMLEKGLTLPEVGVIQAIIFFSTFLLEVPTGVVADKFGRKNSILVGTISHVIALTIFVIAPTFLLFAISAVLTGAAWALISGAEEAYIDDTLVPTQNLSYKQLFSRVIIADESSTILGMLTGTVLVGYWGLQAPLIFAVLSMILAALVLFLFLPKDAQPIDDNDVIIESPSDLKTTLTKYKKFVPLFIVLAILFESARMLWQPALVSQGWSVAQLGVIFAGLKIFSLLGSFVAEEIEYISVSVLGFVGVIGGLALLGLSSQSATLGLIGLSFYFFLENILRINQSSYLLEIIPNKKEKATFLSGSSLIRNITSSAMSPILGWGASYSMGFVLVGLTVLKAGSALMLKSTSQQIKQDHSASPL